MKEISLDTNLYELIKQHPDLKEIMFELGFTEIIKPGMLNTVGRMMSLRKGCNFRKIEISELIKKFEQHNYKVID